MTNITIKTAKELKKFVQKNRDKIIRINDTPFTKNYPLLTISDKYALYYDINSQSDKMFYTPYCITLDK
jgi:hypothetical protein